jgi:hypothetical protein
LPNLFNIFGFLEYNPTNRLRLQIEAYYETKHLFKKIVNTNGSVEYRGGFDANRNIPHPILTDTYARGDYVDFLSTRVYNQNVFSRLANSPPPLPNVMPYTGTSYSRRTERGIPVYRVVQAINALMGYNGQLPDEYTNKGFGSYINFRGFNYIIDFSNLPIHKIPNMYSLDFDQMTILEFCQEICDVINHDLFVSLLPVINHPAVYNLYRHNEWVIQTNQPQKLIAGIIKIDCIDRSKKPEYGAISRYINNLKSQGAEIISSNEGFELSNVSTDKFVVGAQEVDMYLFSGNNDRDLLERRIRDAGLADRCEYELLNRWFISNSLKQQILPFYGFLGKGAVTIPRGYGAYQQILLDSTGLNANGVGNYYVATEMELRAASISYEAWVEFLMQYNDTYLESLEENDPLQTSSLQPFDQNTIDSAFDGAVPTVGIAKEYGVTVPRCVFNSDREYMGPDNLPASPCNPPYGYPLYYKRAAKIGIPEAGLVGFTMARNRLLSNLTITQNNKDKTDFQGFKNALWDEIFEDAVNLSDKEREALEKMRVIINTASSVEEAIKFVEESFNNRLSLYSDINRLSKEQTDNAMKVYEFVRAAADNLGRKFLVKIPKLTNPFYHNRVGLKNYGGSPLNEQVHDILWGPFGFKPRKTSNSISYFNELRFNQQLSEAKNLILNLSEGTFKPILSHGIEKSLTFRKAKNLTPDPNADIFLTEFQKLFENDSAISASGIDALDLTNGALRSRFDAVSNTYVFNYEPEPQGGFFKFDLYRNIITVDEINNISLDKNKPTIVSNLLFPIDATNFINDSNRISAYVRFDNSETLDFSTVSPDNYTQVKIDGVNLVPDLSMELENTRPDIFTSFNPKADPSKNSEKSCAFMKCEIDSIFYMPPKVLTKRGGVFGRVVEAIPKIKPSRRSFNKVTGKEEITFPVYEPYFKPAVSGGLEHGLIVPQEDFDRYHSELFDGDLIRTENIDLDDDHVYALITLPAAVKSRMDSRMVDGLYQQIAAPTIKHFLTQDVVDEKFPGFDSPTTNKNILNLNEGVNNLMDVEDVIKSARIPKTQDVVDSAQLAYEHVLSHMQYNQNNFIAMTAPSPVYPSLVALPLLSKERCYGPWISSFIDKDVSVYRDIPGKVDFIKNETLSPWAYGGYDLMNQAGRVEAEFSNSLLLFSENGVFSYIGLPSGNCLANRLIAGGPLVTSIDIAVGSDNGVTTTINTGLYTPGFGKLQKQKGDLIAKISRERQKLLDERNALIRKGLGKAGKVKNYDIQNFDALINLDSAAEILKNKMDIINNTNEIAFTASPVQDLDVDPTKEVVTREKTVGRPVIANSKRREEIGAISPNVAANTNHQLASANGVPYEGVGLEMNPYLPSLEDAEVAVPESDIDELFR